MIYCLLIGCDDKFEPKKPTDVPERGQVLMIYPWTGAKAAASGWYSTLQTKSQSKAIFSILYRTKTFCV